MEKYGVNGKIIATAGARAQIQKYLLEAAEEMKNLPSCHCYIVGINPDEEDAVYVFEVWENEEAHQAALKQRVFQDLIAKARPFIAGMEDFPSLTIVGGKAEL